MNNHYFDDDKPNSKAVKALAEALGSGGTLLDISCPQCNSPLIKIDDKIYCKFCDKEVIVYKDEKELPPELQKALRGSTRELTTPSSTDSKIEETMKQKIEKLRERLERTDEPDEIIKLSEAIDRLIDTLKKIRDE
ncbi:MAG: hypothetical protein GF308_01105 [Candidatus Heimdallarchaeota archaeon]|nr:hypothetical protein [Candidatus Heimdallarchaeota archaeon]